MKDRMGRPARETVKRYGTWMFYVLLAFVVNFIVEAISRHSVGLAFSYLIERPLVYLYNTALIAVCYLMVYLVRRKILAAGVVTLLWLTAGISNGVLLSRRVTPLTGPDLRMITDALEILSLYTSFAEVALVLGGTALAVFALAVLYVRMPRYEGPMHYKRRAAVTALTVAGFMLLTQTAVEKRVITTFFSNVAYAYQDYGFPYCFATSVLDTGMDMPYDYGEKTILKIVKRADQESLAEAEGGHRPNILFVQLETFFDPTLLRNIELSGDPIPNFHRYMDGYSSGYFEVPVVGAGTANTEFETIVGMNLHYFGPGEYPYKTILKKMTCDSMAYALKDIGYTAHALHNNTAVFYGRNKVFANLGFDTFTPVEMMDCTERNALNWADDSILTEYILDCLKSTEGPDYVYAISVQGHGAYPSEPMEEEPVIRVTRAETEEKRNQYEYYVNQLYEMDQFVEELICALERLGEETVVVLYGDHLPTMGLRASDMKNGHLYSTSYVIWDNLGLPEIDKNLATYQMGAEITGRLGIHEGTMMQYHQRRKGTKYYMQDMEMLQYDMLYGKQYAYDGRRYEPTQLQIGIRQPFLRRVEYTTQDWAYVFGGNFTQFSEVYVNGERKKTQFLNERALILPETKLQKGDVVDVRQVDNKDNELCVTNSYEIVK